MSKIIGYRKVSYVSKKTNNPVSGYELFIVDSLRTSGDADGYGWRWQFGEPTRPLFISVDKFNSILKCVKSFLLNTECTLYFDQFHRFIDIDFKE